MDFKTSDIIHFMNNPIRLKSILNLANNVPNVNNYRDLVKSLQENVCGEIIFFGSRVMKMAHKQSDLDVFVSTGD